MGTLCPHGFFIPHIYYWAEAKEGGIGAVVEKARDRPGWGKGGGQEAWILFLLLCRWVVL